MLYSTRLHFLSNPQLYLQLKLATLSLCAQQRTLILVHGRESISDIASNSLTPHLEPKPRGISLGFELYSIFDYPYDTQSPLLLSLSYLERLPKVYSSALPPSPWKSGETKLLFHPSPLSSNAGISGSYLPSPGGVMTQVP